MEQRRGILEWRAIAIVTVLCIVSTVKSCTELRYTLGGRETKGTVTGTRDSLIGNRRGEPSLVIEYEFQIGPGRMQKGSVSVARTRVAPCAGEVVAVTYLPSSPGTNTLTSERSVKWPIFFVLMLIAFGFTLRRLHREAHGLELPR